MTAVLEAPAAPVAFDVCGVDRVQIRVDPTNAPSLAIPRKLGFVEEARLRRRLPSRGAGPRDAIVFTLFRDDFGDSGLAGAAIEAYDAMEERVL